MGADLVETMADLERNAAQGIPNVGIGADTRIDGARIDKNPRIYERVCITNREGGARSIRGQLLYTRRIVVVAKDAVIVAGSQI